MPARRNCGPSHAGPFPGVGPLPSGRASKLRRSRRAGGLLLMLLGAPLALASTGLFAYATYVDWQLTRVVGDPGPAAILDRSPVPSSADNGSSPPLARVAVDPVSVAPPPPVAEAISAAWPPPRAAEAEAVASPPLPAPPPPPALPPTRLRIPAIGLDARVVHVGTRIEKGQLVWEVPAHAVGHYQMTGLPGQGSNIVMSGHISSPFRGEGSIFNRLPDVRPGNIVVVETDWGALPYEVVSREIVRPTAIDVFDPTPTETLTLITCYPDLIYSHRLVVRATPLPAEID